jgi:hypothetical protein
MYFNNNFLAIINIIFTLNNKPSTSNENLYSIHSEFQLMGSLINWGRCLLAGKYWRTKTNREYNQHLFSLLGHHTILLN